jgi:hypothetical protein
MDRRLALAPFYVKSRVCSSRNWRCNPSNTSNAHSGPYHFRFFDLARFAGGDRARAVARSGPEGDLFDTNSHAEASKKEERVNRQKNFADADTFAEERIFTG